MVYIFGSSLPLSLENFTISKFIQDVALGVNWKVGIELSFP